MAFWAIFWGLGLLFYVLLGSRYICTYSFMDIFEVLGFRVLSFGSHSSVGLGLKESGLGAREAQLLGGSRYL